MSTRLYLTVGVGGVGKTTVSAALALKLAQEGRRTLVITIDPARRLAQELGLDPHNANPQQVGSRPLFGIVLDVRATFDRLIRRLANPPERAQKILDSAIYQHMTRTLIGTQEYMALEVLHEHFMSGTWDAIVLDTPPSKHVVDFFEAPERLGEFFGGTSARWIARFARGTQWMVKGLTLLWGSHFLSELAQFFSDMEGFFDGFSSRAQEVKRVFTGQVTTLFFVTTPARLALEETTGMRARIQQLGFRSILTVVNRMLPEGDVNTGVERLRRAGWPHDIVLHWEQTYRVYEQMLRQQQAVVQAHQGRGGKVIQLVQVDYEISSLEGLESLARQLDLSRWDPVPS